MINETSEFLYYSKLLSLLPPQLIQDNSSPGNLITHCTGSLLNPHLGRCSSPAHTCFCLLFFWVDLLFLRIWNRLTYHTHWELV